MAHFQPSDVKSMSRRIHGLMLPNENGGSCHAGQPCNLVRKREVGEAFLTLWADNCPMQPSVRSVAQEACVGWNHASKVIEELLDTGDLVDPELARPNQMDSGRFVGVGARSLKLEEEVFLPALRTEKPNRPNLDCIRQLERRHGTKVLSPFITKWFQKRFNHPDNFRKPNLVPLDKFKTENLLRCIDFCDIIDKFPNKSIFNFLDEKRIVNKDAMASGIRADPTTAFMDFMPVSGDFHDAFNLFAVVSANPEKRHPIEWITGRENGDSHCFVPFMKHLITSGWFSHDEVLVMDNAAIHTGGDADIVEDLLWDTVMEGRALNVLAPLSQSSTFLLEESNHSNTKLQALALTWSCTKPTEFCATWTALQSSAASCIVDTELAACPNATSSTACPSLLAA
jgi:hypothetical protein